MTAQVGVQKSEEGEEQGHATSDKNTFPKEVVQDCPVRVSGSLSEILQLEKEVEQQQQQQQSKDDSMSTTVFPRYRDKIQVFDFDQFSVSLPKELVFSTDQNNEDCDDCNKSQPSNTCTVSLRQVMEQLKPKIEIDKYHDPCDTIRDDDDDNDENKSKVNGFYDDDDDWGEDIEDEHEVAMLHLHDMFLPIVQEIIRDHDFFASALKHHPNKDSADDRIRIRKYAKPNYRSSTSHYASYLHNDAWFTDDDDDDDDDEVTVGMVNIWFVLNSMPPSNTLVFWETASSTTRQSHMLHARSTTARDGVVVYDRNMAWGRFYIFVAGQRRRSSSSTKPEVRDDNDDHQRVLLHGAMNVPSVKQNDQCNNNVDDDNEDDANVRRSVEMRYTLHVPKERIK